MTGQVMNSDAPEAGELECSSPVFNSIMSAIQWTQRPNMVSVPTDCPQRDERLGWAGDIQVFSPTAMFNRDMAAFLAKWLRDMWDAQTEDGRFPDFAPHPYGPATRFSGNPGWADAGVIVPWLVYQRYGDLRVLEEAFVPARRWVDFGARNNADLIWRDTGFIHPFYYGDWLNADTFLGAASASGPRAEVPHEVYATAFFAHSASLVGRMARELGRDREAEEYSRLARRIRAAFAKAFVSRDGKILGDTQAGYALALSFDLLPAGMRGKAVARMVAALKRSDGALTTGIQSTVRLMLELTRWGHADLAYAILSRKEMPSWRYMVEHGGTTIWERWDGWVEGRGFQKPSMNSFNHWAIGSVGEWMWRVIGGIAPDDATPGCASFTVRPIPGGGLTWAKAAHRSIHGELVVQWQLHEGRFHLDVTIPPNTSARIVLPCASPSRAREGEKPLAEARGLRVVGRSAEGLALRADAGSYHFVVQGTIETRRPGDGDRKGKGARDARRDGDRGGDSGGRPRKPPRGVPGAPGGRRAHGGDHDDRAGGA
jgi:alpha-L-rhamnosidase